LFARKTGIIAVLLCLALLVQACSSGGKAVATVDGEKITQEELDARVSQMSSQLKAAYGVDLEQEEYQDLLPEIQNQALESLIADKLLQKTATDNGLKVEDDKVQAEIDLAAEQLGGKDKLEEYLKEQNITLEELREMIRLSMLQEQLFEQVTAEITASEEEVENYFTEHQADLEQVKVSHILINADETTASPEEVTAAESQAREIIDQLNGGADFAALAKEKSQDPGSAENGGLMDRYFTRNDPYLLPEFVAGAFEVAEGEFSQEPVKTAYGFHIIKVDDKKDTLAELRPDIEATLVGEQKNQAFNDFMLQKYSQAKIERLVDFTPKPDEPGEPENAEDQQPDQTN